MRLFTTILLSLFTLSLTAQKVNYDIIKDEPVEPKISIALDLFQLDANTGWPDIRVDNISFNIGLIGYVKILPMLEIDYNLHKGILTLGRLANENYPGNTDLNAGVNFLLSSRTKRKESKVVLDQSSNGSTSTTTYLMVPANVKKRFGLRAGVRFKNGPFNYSDYIDGDFTSDIQLQELGMLSTGVYGGLMLRSITNIVIENEEYGVSFNSLGSDLYLDVLINPVNRFVDVNNNNQVVSQEVKDAKSAFPIGFRLGYETFQVEQ
jgi:hypothetical protein